MILFFGGLALAAELPPGVCEPGWLIDGAGRCARQQQEAGFLAPRADALWLPDGDQALLRAFGQHQGAPSRTLERIEPDTGAVLRLADTPASAAWLAGDTQRGLWAANPNALWRLSGEAWAPVARPPKAGPAVDLAVGPEGAAWLSEAASKRVWVVDAAGTTTAVRLPKRGASLHFDAAGVAYAQADGWWVEQGGRWKKVPIAEATWVGPARHAGLVVLAGTGWWMLQGTNAPVPLPAPPLPEPEHAVVATDGLWLIPRRGVPVGWDGRRWELGPPLPPGEAAPVAGRWAVVDPEGGRGLVVDPDGAQRALGAPGALVGAVALAHPSPAVLAPTRAGVAGWALAEGVWRAEPRWGPPAARLWAAEAGGRAWAVIGPLGGGPGEVWTRAEGAWTRVGSLPWPVQDGALAATEAGALWVDVKGGCALSPTEPCARIAGLRGRPGASAVGLADGRVLVVAGAGQAEDVREQTGAPVDLVDLAAATAARLPSLPGDRVGAAAARLADGSVLVVGGKSGGRRPVLRGDSWRWTGEVGGWAPSGHSLGRSVGAALVPLADGGALLVGGGGARLERFEVGNTTWSAGPALAVGRSGASAVWLGDSLLVVGGRPDDRGVVPVAERVWVSPGPAWPWLGAVEPSASAGLGVWIRDGLAAGRELEALIADPEAPQPDAAGELDGRRASCLVGRGADCVAVARALERGEGVPADAEAAKLWRKRACEAGIVASCGGG